MRTSDFRQQDIYILGKNLYALITSFTKDGISYTLKDQIERSAISIVLNFAEGYGRYHKNDKKQFYIMARASLNEVIACYDLITISKSINPKDARTFDELTVRLSKMLSGLINAFKE